MFDEKPPQLTEETSQITPIYLPQESHMVAMELAGVKEDAVIPERIWEQVLEKELTCVWDALIPNTGDELIVKGSSANRIFFGSYAVEADTGKIIAPSRPDVDIVIREERGIERFEKAGQQVHRGNIATIALISGIEVSVASNEKIRESNVTALNELEKWAILQAQSTGQVEAVEALVAQFQDTKRSVERADYVSMLNYDNISPFDSLAIRLVRTEGGKVEARVIDSDGLLVEIAAVNSPANKNENPDDLVGFSISSTHRRSVPSLCLAAMICFKDGEFSSNAPLWAANAIPRAMKSACELDLELAGAGEPKSDYDFLYAAAQRLARNRDIFEVTKPDGTKVESQEWFKRQMQASFARSCAGNAQEAVAYMTMYFDTGCLLSEEVGDYFGLYHSMFEPNTFFGKLITKDHTSKDLPFTLADGEDILKVPDIPPLRAYMTFCERYKARFGVTAHQIQTAGGMPELGGNAMYYTEAAKPSGMSEVMAILFKSMGWEMPAYREKIQKVVESWTPEGKLEKAWTTTKSEFDVSLNLQQISSYMEEM